MDIAAITEALGQVDPAPLPPEALGQPGPRARAVQLAADLKLTKKLEQVLAAEPIFAPGSMCMISHGSGAYGLDPSAAAIMLLRRYRRTGDAPGTSRWLKEAFDRNDMGYRAILGLYGVVVTEAVSLTDSIEIVPFAALPPSPTKETLIPDYALWSRVPFAGYESAAPTAAIIARGRLRPFIRPGDDMPGIGDEIRLREAALALTIAGPCSPLEAGAWYELEDQDLMTAAGSGMSRQHFEVTPMFRHRERPLDTLKAPAVVQNYLKSTGVTRDRLTIAIARLNQAMRRSDSSPDRALDLAIGLESLLSSGPGGNAHKVSLRAALLYPGTAEQRIEVRGMISTLFNLRNEVAHQGRLPYVANLKVPKKQLKSSVLLTKLEPVIATVIRAVLERGRVPSDGEWYELEVTGGASIRG
jgi:hypothetical protein